MEHALHGVTTELHGGFQACLFELLLGGCDMLHKASQVVLIQFGQGTNPRHSHGHNFAIIVVSGVAVVFDEARELSALGISLPNHHLGECHQVWIMAEIRDFQIASQTVKAHAQETTQREIAWQ